jgi:hypothetical protein
MGERTIRFTHVLALWLALVQGGCSLSMTGKDHCLVAADCLDGNKCSGGVCIPASSCTLPCGNDCCGKYEYCDQATITCKVYCTPTCAGRQCGDDSCGGCCNNWCTDCGAGTTCLEHMCETCNGYCVPGNECGPDGCGRKCGTCQPNQHCDESYRCVYGTYSDAGMNGPDSSVAHSDANTQADTGAGDGGVIEAEPDASAIGGDS